MSHYTICPKTQLGTDCWKRFCILASLFCQLSQHWLTFFWNHCHFHTLNSGHLGLPQLHNFCRGWHLGSVFVGWLGHFSGVFFWFNSSKTYVLLFSVLWWGSTAWQSRFPHVFQKGGLISPFVRDNRGQTGRCWEPDPMFSFMLLPTQEH